MAMFKNVKSHRQTTHPEFLVDTAAFQGVSQEFEMIRDLVTRSLRRDQSLQNQLMSEEPIRNAVELLFQKYQRLEIVIAGWIDQAVLEFHSSLQGDNRCLSKMLDQLDAYRPDQNGDMCFYLADLDYNQVLATVISFEDGVISTKSYRRSSRADPGP
jgi:hypothetical protein